MKFDLGQSTLTTLTKHSRGSSDDLGALIKQLITAAEPLEGTFNGAGRAAFDAFKARADQITAELNSSLTAIIGAQTGMDTAFTHSDHDMSDNARVTEQNAAFDTARFHRSR